MALWCNLLKMPLYLILAWKRQTTSELQSSLSSSRFIMYNASKSWVGEREAKEGCVLTQGLEKALSRHSPSGHISSDPVRKVWWGHHHLEIDFYKRKYSVLSLCQLCCQRWHFPSYTRQPVLSEKWSPESITSQHPDARFVVVLITLLHIAFLLFNRMTFYAAAIFLREESINNIITYWVNLENTVLTVTAWNWP